MIGVKHLARRAGPRQATAGRWRRPPARSRGEPPIAFAVHFELILEGARRSERTFSLTRFSFDSTADAERFGALCTWCTRMCDAVQAERDQVIVVWDGTDPHGAMQACQRLIAACGGQLAGRCRAATVSYPQAGYTAGALMQALASSTDEVELDSAATVADLAAARHDSERSGRRQFDRFAG